MPLSKSIPLRKTKHVLDTQTKINLENNCHHGSTAADRSYFGLFCPEGMPRSHANTCRGCSHWNTHILANSHPCSVSRCWEIQKYCSSQQVSVPNVWRAWEFRSGKMQKTRIKRSLRDTGEASWEGQMGKTLKAIISIKSVSWANG